MISLPPSRILWPAQHAVVLGGSGFLGKAIIRQLLARGCGRITAYNRSAISDEFLTQGVRWVGGDLGNRSLVQDAFHSATVIFHVAAKTGVWGRRADFFRVNTLGTRQLLALAQTAENRPVFIHTGSPSALYRGTDDLINFEEPVHFIRQKNYLSPYPESKAEAEMAVRAAASPEFKTMVIRPHLIYGPEDPHILPRILERARANRLIQVGNGQNRVDLTYIENAAWGHLCAAEALLNPTLAQAFNGRGFVVSDQAPVILWDWIRNFLERMETHPPRFKLSYPMAYTLGALCEKLSFGKEPPVTRFTAAQLSHSHTFDFKAVQGMGYTPLIPPETAFEKTVKWFKEKQ